MRGNFQYILMGAMICLLAIGGIFAISLQHLSADASTSLDQQSFSTLEPDTATNIAIPQFSVANSPIKTEAHNPIVLIEATSSEESISQITHLGTAENPQTDKEVIIQQVMEFIAKQEKAILGRPGWLHLQVQSFMPVEFRGNGEPATGLTISDLYPDDTTINDNWYFIDEQGYYQQRIGHTQAMDSRILQRVVFVNGKTVNLTIQAANPDHAPFQTRHNQEKIDLHGNILYLLQEGDRSGTEVNAWYENGNYTVTVTTWYTEPEPFMNSEKTIYGSQHKYILDQLSGAFLVGEYLLNDGEVWFVLERNTVLNLEMIEELPKEAQESLNAFTGQQ